MFDPYAQLSPWLHSVYGTGQPYGLGPQQFQPGLVGWQVPYAGVQGQQPSFQGPSPWGQFGFAQPIPPQTWFGSPIGQFGPFSNPMAQQLFQQIPQLVQNAHQIAHQLPQLIQQLPQIIQQNPQLVQQAPQLQQVPQLLHQAAVLAQQVPHVLQALCASPHTQGGGFGLGPILGSGGFRPLPYGPTVFS